MGYAGLLFLLMVFVIQPDFERVERLTASGALLQQFIGFMTLTLPVVLVLSWMEAGRWRGTIGKRLIGLKVRCVNDAPLGLPRSVGRNSLKFLPWEIAHTGVNQAFVPDHPLPWLGITLSVASMVLVAIYLASCVLGSGRTIYDRLTRSRIA